jgi:very-short-patch-repair endonuclease
MKKDKKFNNKRPYSSMAKKKRNSKQSKALSPLSSSTTTTPPPCESSLNPILKGKVSQERKPSTLERKFDLLWASVKGQPLGMEYRFHPVRKWRSDYVHYESRTLIEIEGGAWGGRHCRGAGFLSDSSKYFEAAMMGFHVIRLTAPMITTDTLERLKEFLEKNTNAFN